MSVEHEMLRVGRIVAADQGLTVHVRGAQAFAVPGEVTIPSIDSWSVLGRNAKRMLHGLLDHETAHAMFTDFDVMGATRLEAAYLDKVRTKYRVTEDEVEKLRKYHKVLPTIYNVIEDAWIERKQSARYLGCEVNLRLKNQWFWDVTTERRPSAQKRLEEPADMVEAVVTGLIVVTRHVKTLAELSAYSVHPYLLKCRAVLARVDTCESSIGALRLALEVGDLLFNDPPPPPPPEPEPEESEEEPPPPESEPAPGEEEDEEENEDEAGSDSDESDEEDEEEGEDESESGAGDTDEEDGDEEESDDTEDGEGNGEASDEGDCEDELAEPGSLAVEMEEFESSPLTPEEAINIEIQAAFDYNDGGARPYVVFSHEWDLECDLSRCDLRSETKEFAEIEAAAQSAVGPLIQAFETVLKSRQEKRWVGGHDEGFADPSLLALYSVGSVPSDQVFMQPVAEDETACVVSILIDSSGSMAGPKSELTRQCGYAISKALTACQIPHELTGFTTIDSHYTTNHQWAQKLGLIDQVNENFKEARRLLIDQQKRGVDVSKFARGMFGSDDPREAVMLMPSYAIFKSFSQDELRALVHIEGIGANLDGEAVLWQARRLMERPEQRRIMMVLSDGMPAGARDHPSEVRYLKDAVRRTTEAGIEVVGVGIKTNAVSIFYPDHVVVNDINELASTGLITLLEVLTRTRQEHQCVRL